MLVFVAGVGVGAVMAAPVGPMGALAAFQAANGKVRPAWALALGVCAADGILAMLATWGVGLPVPDHVLAAGVAVLMAAMAWHLWQAARHPKAQAVSTGKGGTLVAFGATLMHPGNFIAFAMAFAWLDNMGLSMTALPAKLLMVAGVLAGALGLWAALIHVAQRFGKTLPLERLQARMTYGLAVLCAAAAAGALYSLI